MNDLSVLWDRLAGEIEIYVKNYLLKKYGTHGISPSYNVDYKIENINELLSNKSAGESWSTEISECRNINDLPKYLQNLIRQFLPLFFEKYPKYRFKQCLRINES